MAKGFVQRDLMMIFAFISVLSTALLPKNVSLSEAEEKVGIDETMNTITPTTTTTTTTTTNTTTTIPDNNNHSNNDNMNNNSNNNDDSKNTSDSSFSGNGGTLNPKMGDGTEESGTSADPRGNSGGEFVTATSHEVTGGTTDSERRRSQNVSAGKVSLMAMGHTEVPSSMSRLSANSENASGIEPIPIVEDSVDFHTPEIYAPFPVEPNASTSVPVLLVEDLHVPVQPLQPLVPVFPQSVPPEPVLVETAHSKPIPAQSMFPMSVSSQPVPPEPELIETVHSQQIPPQIAPPEPIPPQFIPPEPIPPQFIPPEPIAPEPVPILGEPVHVQSPDNSAPSFHAPWTESPFERVQDTFPDFESQMVALHFDLCGSTCWFSMGKSSSFKSYGCSECFCDSICSEYGDCCPDLQLLGPTSSSFSSAQQVNSRTRDRQLYTCEISHMKPKQYEEDYDNYFSMLNYCPPARSHLNTTALHLSGDSNAEDDLPSVQPAFQSLQSRCENKENSSHWSYVLPVTSQAGLVYRNRFCAQCHGEQLDNMTVWDTTLLCDADLLYTVTSAKEAYYLALNTPQCDIRFKSVDLSSIRRCNSVRHPVISSCNITGEWRHYDDRLVRACASFTSPVLKKYRNVFCYLCNQDLIYEIARYLLRQGVQTANIGRVSFYALLDFSEEDEDGGKEVAVQEGSTALDSEVRHLAEIVIDCEEVQPGCGVGMVFDPVQCRCEPVKCGAGLRVDKENCTEVFAASNYFGFSVCTRIHITGTNHNESALKYVDILMWQLGMQSGPFTVKEARGFPRLDCHDQTKATLDVVMTVYSIYIMHMRELANAVLRSTRVSIEHLSTLEDFNLTYTLPAADCISPSQWMDSIPDHCPTKNASISLGIHSVAGYAIQGVKNQMAFSTLYNTTFCPHVKLSETMYNNFIERIKPLILMDLAVPMDVTVEGNQTVYLMCARDYLSLLNSSVSHKTHLPISGSAGVRSGFQDTWTVLGVTSVVCTCVSLVSLLCVIVTYTALPALRAGAGKSTLCMACLLFVAQALHEMGIEQFEIAWLCLLLALLIHFFWLAAVFMMSCCTLQLFVTIRFPIKAKVTLASRKILTLSLVSSFGLSGVIVGLTVSVNKLVHGDLGYPAKYLCFIHRPLSRQLGFGLPLGLAVLFNVLLFLVIVIHVRRRPQLGSTRHERVSLLACFRLSVMTGCCWLSLFLMALPATRPWLEYVFVALLGLQGLLLASTLLLNRRVIAMWRDHLFKFFRAANSTSGARCTRSSGTKFSSDRHQEPHFFASKLQDK